jgi:hypothetical protein
VIAAGIGIFAAAIALFGTRASAWCATHLPSNCPTCEGTFETCTCGTHKPGVPR